ncbi:chromosome segregation protein [Chitinivorax tropicus]|uniref:Chromosome partition protein Smc n=1 Tax=Chitinivorax tropicus TaxID=714531 RepID=A0A840MNR3_9PROT|nr:chromosome segregation protein SMC [Chitinivorax tropicus]MBB5016881.1 chromosome segregation protein [Chitinivorax tropicus]
MRLSQIKLAGFKSFVDPQQIPVPGQLVAVVGPNGCGKSNVIDAVRWVLGESSAKQLRGESMQDVIFNGSDHRKPVGRASVELVFDNSLGRAAGQWSQYAEISIKRVLTRQGESSYFINNIQCRRRDIQDLFLGTGVGTRGYAVIEQGMISRIIEARPEELRVFLEEAAGVSKYKERRKETEARLNDTRDNLTRVDDIRQELESQLEKLAVQAEVAEKYQQLKQTLENTQNLLALLRKLEAQKDQEKLTRDIATAVNDLEAATAQLRDTESQLEQLRETHFTASDELHAVQGRLYEANAEVARLEQQIIHLKDSRGRLGNQISQAKAQLSQLQQQVGTTDELHLHWQSETEVLAERVEWAQTHLLEANEAMPALESAWRTAQQSFGEIQQKLAQVKQARELEAAHGSHALKTIQQLEARRERLRQEQAAQPSVDQDGLTDMEEAIAELEARRLMLEDQLAALQEDAPRHEQTKRDAQHALQQSQQHLTRLEAQHAALARLQQQADQDQQLQTWLARHQLLDANRFWQGLQVEAGWETALEAVLVERLQALPMPVAANALLADRAPARLALFNARAGSDLAPPSLHGWLPLQSKVQAADPRCGAALGDWLSHVWCAESITDIEAAQAALPDGGWVVLRDGLMISRTSARFHAEQDVQSGMLARQRELTQLAQAIEAQAVVLESAQQTAQHSEQTHASIFAELQRKRGESDQLGRQLHQQQMELLRQQQSVERVMQRRQQIAHELAEITEAIALENEARGEAAYKQTELDEQLAHLDEAMASVSTHRTQTDTALEAARNRLRDAEREAREAEFQLKTAQNKIIELEGLKRTHGEQQDTLLERIESLQLELDGFDPTLLDESIQAALNKRGEREVELAKARDAVGHATNKLRELESDKMRIEHGQEPLRERINELRLKEQEARLAVERFTQELQEAGADEAALLPMLPAHGKVSTFVGQIGSLTQQLNALGAVNLAAMQELEESRTRKAFLDAQAADLTEAMDTLEGAIRKIDKESSDLLQATFDKVNASMMELFPLLFGGGQARLVMTGETILDAGVQVIAQPPGKKNSTIHLLSGGEKALTALSLVFALFQLNPAPFCLLDEVDAPLDDANTSRFCDMVKRMSANTQFLYISHNKITMEMADQLVGITMQEKGVSRVVAVDIEAALSMAEPLAS